MQDWWLAVAAAHDPKERHAGNHQELSHEVGNGLGKIALPDISSHLRMHDDRRKVIPMKLTYARIFADAHGESHFEDATIMLEAADLAPPMRPVPISAPIAAKRIIYYHGPENHQGSEWHPAPARQFMYVLTGRIEITVSDGETRVFSPGDMVLLEDTHGKGHSGKRPSGGVTAALVQLE